MNPCPRSNQGSRATANRAAAFSSTFTGNPARRHVICPFGGGGLGQAIHQIEPTLQRVCDTIGDVRGVRCPPDW